MCLKTRVGTHGHQFQFQFLALPAVSGAFLSKLSAFTPLPLPLTVSQEAMLPLLVREACRTGSFYIENTDDENALYMLSFIGDKAWED